MSVVLVFIALFFVYARPAQAYIDPGTGSFIFQLLLGFFVGGMYLMKVFWQQFISFFSSKSSTKKPPASESHEEEA